MPGTGRTLITLPWFVQNVRGRVLEPVRCAAVRTKCLTALFDRKINPRMGIPKAHVFSRAMKGQIIL